MHWETLRIKLNKNDKTFDTFTSIHFFCLILIVPSSSLRSLFGGTRSKIYIYTFGFLINKFDTYRSILYIDIYYIKL